jgi:tripartite-type tricarboxylate transporter receptor subunit TctC
MTRPTQSRRLALCIGMAALLPAMASAQQAFPSRPLRVIVPFAAGGGTDIIARALAVKMAEATNQQVVVDNRTGGGTVIASEIVARSSPDGHTLLLTANPHTSNPALYPKLPYDTVRDFAAVTMLASSPLVLAVHPSVPANSVKELVAAARARPGQYAYGTSGNGGPQHIAGELFKSMAGVDLIHVPYRGGAPASADLIAGQVQVGFGSVFTTLPHVKSGRLRGLAVTSPQRAPTLPEMPTIAESGLPGYESVTWYGVFVPGTTPAATVAALNAIVVRALRHPDVGDRLAKEGSDVVGSTPAVFREFVVAEIEKLRKLARQTGLRAD